MTRQRGTLARDLARGSVIAFAIYMAGAMVTFVAQLLLARMIGAAGYGAYAYVLAWMTLLAYLSALGFEVSLLRMVAAYEVRGEWGLLRGVIRYAERRSLAAGVCIAVLGIAGTLALRGRMSPVLWRTFLVGFPMVPLWALLWLRGSSLRALGGVFLALAPDRLVRDGVLLLVLAAAVFSIRMDAPRAMLASVAGTAVGLAIVTLALRRRRVPGLAGSKPQYRASEWRRIVLPLLALAVSEVALNRTGVLFLGWFGHTKDAGIFALAFNLASVVSLPRIAVNATFAPAISSLYTRGDTVRLQAMITRTSLWSLGGAAAIALALAVMAGPFLAWFGHDFQPGLAVVWVLLLGQLTIAAGGTPQFLMTMTGKERGAAMILVPFTVANAVLTPICIGLFGTIGAAVAMSGVICGWQIAIGIYVRLRLGLVPGVLGSLRRPFRVQAALALSDRTPS